MIGEWVAALLNALPSGTPTWRQLENLGTTPASAFVGRTSFGVYLLHMIVLMFVVKIINRLTLVTGCSRGAASASGTPAMPGSATGEHEWHIEQPGQPRSG